MPELHYQRSNASIRLAVVQVMHPMHQPTGDPIFFLPSGPGLPVQSLVSTIDKIDAALLTSNDFVIFDQRGTGQSLPSLNCVNIEDQSLSDFTRQISTAEETSNLINAFKVCQDGLVGKGINLSAYSSDESAADVNDIRMALGYGKVNLLGVSYGTRLALTVARDFPNIVATSVLDSVVPLQENLYTARPATYDWSYPAFVDRSMLGH